MHKITDQALKAFWNNVNFKQGNTKVIASYPISVMYLHGNLIAKINGENNHGYLTISSCGWKTNTTKDRLNGVLARLGYQIQQRKGEWSVYNSQTEESVLFTDGMQFRI